MRVTLPHAAVISIALLLPAVSHAQDAASAKAFLESTYQTYDKNGNGVDLSGPHANQYFHSSLTALIRADEKAAEGYVPACCDADPVCSCQDRNGIWDLKITVIVLDPKEAEATVSFSLDAPKERKKDDLLKLKITLVPERGQWRIYDILDETPGQQPFGLRKATQKEIEAIAHHPHN